MQSCNTIGNGQLKRSHPSCPGRRLAHFHMRLVPFFMRFAIGPSNVIFLYIFFTRLSREAYYLDQGFGSRVVGLRAFAPYGGGFRICVSRPCLKKPPSPPARAFQKQYQMGRKKYDKRSANQNMHSQKKKRTQQKFARNAPGGQKCRAKTFIGTSKCCLLYTSPSPRDS